MTGREIKTNMQMTAGSRLTFSLITMDYKRMSILNYIISKSTASLFLVWVVAEYLNCQVVNKAFELDIQ